MCEFLVFPQENINGLGEQMVMKLNLMHLL